MTAAGADPLSGRGLLERVALPEDRDGAEHDDARWIEVIRKMDEIYAELVRYQVELEEKNSELEQAHRFISDVLGTMSDAVVVCDRDGTVIEGNRALEALCGQPGDAIRDRSLVSLFASEHEEAVERLRRRARSVPVHDVELSLRGAAESVPVSVSATARHDAEGFADGLVLTCRPVGELRRAYRELNLAHTELQETQAQLVQAEKMASLGRLVAGVAHELNNPISFVTGNVHVLERGCQRIHRYFEAARSGASREELEAMWGQLRMGRVLDELPALLEGTKEGAERVKDIVEDLKCFSASPRGDAQRLNLSEVVHAGLRWATRGQRFDVAVSEDLPAELPVTGHPGPLQQVVINLVQNAVDAMAEVGAPRLEVSGRAAGGEAQVEFRDNGAGMSPEALERLFEPFYTTKPVGEGTGLGLSISYGVVRDHGGTLSAGNRTEGGAWVRLTLPLAQE